jgi:hypothetical protein
MLDHDALEINIPYTMLGLFPPVDIRANRANRGKQLVTPMTQQDKETLCQALAQHQTREWADVYDCTTKLVDNWVRPHWEESTRKAGDQTADRVPRKST